MPLISPAILALSTQITAIIGPNSYNLVDGSIAFRLSDSDLAMPPVRRLAEQGPVQHGDSDLGFRLDARLFALTLKTAQNQTMAQLYDNRKQIINIFKPLSGLPIKLCYTLPNGDVRQIDCHVQGSLKIDEESREGFMQTAVIPLRAADPTFYDPSQIAVPFGLTAGGTPTTVPLAVPFNVGTSTINQTVAVSYTGTWPVNPIITIYGPMTDAVIQNLTTGEKLDFTGYTITDQLVIDTRYGFKTVKDGSGTNQIAKISDDSSLATFHLDVDPVAPGGANNIKVTGSGATAATQAYLQYYNRYIGI